MTLPAITLTYINTITLEYPPVTPTITLQLPRPILTDTHEINKTRVLRQSRANNLHVFADTDWPTLEIFRYNIIRLTETQKNNWITLVKASLGKDIKLTDYQSREFTGIIINPTEPMTDNFKECGWQIRFDFQVTL